MLKCTTDCSDYGKSCRFRDRHKLCGLPPGAYKDKTSGSQPPAEEETATEIETLNEDTTEKEQQNEQGDTVQEQK